MRLRPHHLLDIITQYGAGVPFQPHPYGHAVHSVAATVLADPDVTIEFVVGADDVCRHLIAGHCDDVLTHLDPPLSKQDYNDDLDRRVLAHLALAEGSQLTCRAFLALVRRGLPGIAHVCTHPKEDPASRLSHLTAGLEALSS